MINCTFENGNKNSLRHVVVDMLILKDKQLLLVKRTKGKILEGGKWALVGGFVERDETTTQAAEREIFEETGWKVKDMILFRIVDNPDRRNEDRQNISFVYLCQALSQEGKPDWEVDEAKFFDLEQLPSKEEIAFDHLDSIELYKKYFKKPFSLPKLG